MNFYPLVVSDIIDETPSARSFSLKVDTKLQSTFNFKAGQFLSLRLPWEGGYLDRCYSLASTPDDAELKFTVKRVVDGRASNYLNDEISIGDIIDVAPPTGRFTLGDSPLPLTLFAAGSGITPVISIVKQALANTKLSVRLLYANSNSQQVIFSDELHDLCQRYSERFYCQHHISSDQGRVNENTVTQFLSESLENDFYICGPTPFMDLIESVLEKFGVNDHHIFTERFISDAEPIQDDQDVDTNIVSFDAVLDGEHHTVPYLKGKTLLESMLENDLKPSYFCQQARCGMCVVTKTAGEVMMRNSDILSDADKEKGHILLCQSVALSDDISVNCDHN